MRPIGRIGLEWIKRRKRWIADNPPNYEGAWVCYICGQWVYEDDMELDHVEPKSSTPKEISDSNNNLKPTHGFPCNQQKGSTRLKKPKRIRDRSNEW